MRPNGVVPVVGRAAERELHASLGQVAEDIQRVADAAGQAVQLGDGERVALADGRQRLVQAGTRGWCR